MNKQLKAIDAKVVAAKVNAGKALTLAELSVHIGVGYSQVRAWKLPLLAGKIFYDDFTLWRRRKLGLESGPQTPAHRQRATAGKCG